MNEDEDSLFSEICEYPESDELRLEYALWIEATDPERAAFIRLQLDIATRRRHAIRLANDRRIYPWYAKLEAKADALLRKNRARWSRDLASLIGHRRIVFDRGFPAFVELQPLIFAADADRLFEMAPIRHIDFVQPVDAAQGSHEGRKPFPIDLILECPQLSRLHSLGLLRAVLVPSNAARTGTVAKIAQCPRLTRCAYIAFVFTDVTKGDLFDLADGVLTSRMLGISSEVGEVSSAKNDASGRRYFITTFDKAWREIEFSRGYIPWLHRSHNGDHRLDARWLIEHAGFPKYQPQSPPNVEWYSVPELEFRDLLGTTIGGERTSARGV